MKHLGRPFSMDVADSAASGTIRPPAKRVPVLQMQKVPPAIGGERKPSYAEREFSGANVPSRLEGPSVESGPRKQANGNNYMAGGKRQASESRCLRGSGVLHRKQVAGSYGPPVDGPTEHTLQSSGSVPRLASATSAFFHAQESSNGNPDQAVYNKLK